MAHWKLSKGNGDIMSIREYDSNYNLISEIAKGCVIGEREHFWMDGMLEVFAIYYDAETDSIKEKQTEYSGADCRNLMLSGHDIDLTVENARKAMRCLKRMALDAYKFHLKEMQRTFAKGDTVKVIRGRKVPKGSILSVFWCGKKYNMYKRADEELIGAYNEKGEKVWVLAEYCEHLEPYRETAKQRKEWIKHHAWWYTQGQPRYREIDRQLRKLREE